MKYKKKSCFFIGHSDSDYNIYGKLKEVIEEHIMEYGVTNFYVGHYGNFDRLAAKAIIDLKTNYSYIRLTLLLPYHPSEIKIELPNGFDSSYYPDGMESVPRRLAIIKANQHMIDCVDYLIANVKYSASNSGKLLEYALKRKNKEKIGVVNLDNIN